MTMPLAPQVEAHTLFSLDIFDTLLHRYTKSPIDAFRFMEKAPAVEVVTGDFPDIRVAAEHLAREDAAKRKAEDVTLDEIYTCFADITKCSPEQAEAIKALELETEMDLLHPTRFATSFLDHVRGTSKRFILASDMYLPTSALEKILAAKGITGYEKLLVSGDVGRTKHHGTLFEDVISHYGVEAKEILHIGDNKHADGRRSREAGLTPLVINASKDIPARSPKPRKNTHLLLGCQPLTQVFISHYLEHNHAGAQQLNFADLDNEAYLEAFGAVVVAPLMTSFMTWMHDHLVRRGIKRIAFLARDGMFPQRVFDTLYPEGFETDYIAASRRILTIPFSVMEPGTIVGMFETTVAGCETAGEFLECISGAPELGEFLEKNGVPLGEPLNRDLRKKLLATLKSDPEFLMGTFRPEQDAIIEYFNAKFPAGQETALFDVGWRGSLQHAIAKIIDPTAQVVGFYFGTGWSAVNMLQRAGHTYESYACSNGTPGSKSERIEGFRDLVEFLCSADHGSVLRLSKSASGDFEWEMAEVKEAEKVNLDAAATIQNAAIDAIAAVTRSMPVEVLSKYASTDDVEDFWSFVLKPQRGDALRFKDIRVFAGVGDNTGESLTRIGDKKSHYYNAKNSRWRQAYGAHLGKFTKARVNLVMKARKRPKL